MTTLGQGSGATGNDARVKSADIAADAAQRALNKALKRVMATDDGKEIIWEILSRAGLFQTTFAADPALSAFRQGRREFGLELYVWIRTQAEEDYQVMEQAVWKRGGPKARDEKPVEGETDVASE